MIWITLLIFLIADAYVEHLRAFKATVKRTIGVNHYVSTIYRLVYAADIVWHYQLKGKELLCFAVGAFFGFWCLFNLVLNFMNDRPWDWLGSTAWLDRLESKAPFPIIFAKVIISSGFIYAYYHTNQL